MPALSHNPAALRMSNSEYSLLGFVQGNVLSGSAFHGVAELRGCNPQVSDDADIVEQAGQVSFSRLGKPDLACELPANKRAAKGMFPKHDGVKTCWVALQKFKYGTGHGDISHALHSQRHHCRANTINLLPLSKQRRIRQLQALGR